MKIQINSHEFYQIDTEQTIDANDFFMLLERLNQIGKIVSKGTRISDELEIKDKPLKEKKEKLREPKSHFIWDRNRVMDLFQYVYHGDVEDRERISEIIGQPFKNIQATLHNLRIRHALESKEVGLKKWLGRNEGRIPKKVMENRIPGFKIISRSGVFD